MEQRSGMVEKRGMGLWLTHGFMITGVLIIFFPIWLAFVASTVTQPEIVSPPMPLLPGGHFWENYKTALLSGVNVPVATMLMNSLIMAIGIAVGHHVDEQFDYGDRNCRWQNYHLSAQCFCHCIFSVSGPHHFLLDDFLNLDAARRSAHFTHL